MKKRGLLILGFLGFLLVENIVDRIFDRAIEWIGPATPHIMFIIYNIAMTLVTIAFAAAVVYILSRTLWGVWKLLTDRGQRRNLWENAREKVRRWPTGKTDAFTAIVTTWTIAIFVPFFVLIFTIPREQLAGRIPAETLIIILTLAIVPMYALLLWYGYEYVKRLRQKWHTETRNVKIRIAVPVIVFILILALFVWGDISGWDDRAWFAN